MNMFQVTEVVLRKQTKRVEAHRKSDVMTTCFHGNIRKSHQTLNEE